MENPPLIALLLAIRIDHTSERKLFYSISWEKSREWASIIRYLGTTKRDMSAKANEFDSEMIGWGLEGHFSKSRGWAFKREEAYEASDFVSSIKVR